MDVLLVVLVIIINILFCIYILTISNDNEKTDENNKIILKIDEENNKNKISKKEVKDDFDEIKYEEKIQIISALEDDCKELETEELWEEITNEEEIKEILSSQKEEDLELDDEFDESDEQSIKSKELTQKEKEELNKMKVLLERLREKRKNMLAKPEEDEIIQLITETLLMSIIFGLNNADDKKRFMESLDNINSLLLQEEQITFEDEEVYDESDDFSSKKWSEMSEEEKDKDIKRLLSEDARRKATPGRHRLNDEYYDDFRINNPLDCDIDDDF